MIALIAAQFFAAEPLHEWMLEDASGDTSLNWQNHLSSELVDADAAGDYSSFVATIRSGLATNSLIQIDLFNQECLCAVSIKPFSQSEERKSTQIIRKLLKGYLPYQRNFKIGDAPFPFDFARVQNVSQAHTLNLVDQDDHTHQIMDVFNVMLPSGQSIGLKLHRNVNNSSNAHSVMLYGLGALITALSCIVLFAAERLMRRSRKAEKTSLEKAQYLAEHDTLTGFLNRYGFNKRVQEMLKGGDDVKGFLIVYDADNFKEVNDQHGHDMGDKVLVEMAKLLRESFPKDAAFGRLGGDEFAVFARSASQWRNVDNFIATRKTKLKLSLPHAGRDLETTVSAGYARFPDHADTFKELIKAADLALLEVKKDSKSTIGVYNTEMKERFERRIWEIQGIRTAVETGRIMPYYQPIVSSQDGQICLLEALARWKHPKEGTLPPGAFQNALEDPNISRLLTGAMLNRIVSDLKTWWDQGTQVQVSLNLGQADLKQPELPDLLSAALDRFELPPSALMVEVTESAVAASNMAKVLHVLNEIRKRDIEIALDDFGTGASSITLLRALPCCKLKIDKSFVDEVALDGDDNAIVRALTRLGHDLNMNIVVEGVENQEQETVLREIGADYLQGYLYAAPVPFDQVAGLVRKHGFKKPDDPTQQAAKIAS